MNNTDHAVAGAIVGILLGFGLGIGTLAATSGVDRHTTYVCAPLVSGEPVGKTITVGKVTHNCVKS